MNDIIATLFYFTYIATDVKYSLFLLTVMLKAIYILTIGRIRPSNCLQIVIYCIFISYLYTLIKYLNEINWKAPISKTLKLDISWCTIYPLAHSY